ncbi:hypothetical protein NE237_025123 [Protea cynaroides]|uniref:Bet v I/Major latex protein domain-containing protein n=1 Tax=Protea cynaroides TaxID=273540 RepID=A0A9Q0H1B5_9MAGN|nr:hypothetical protein NE237_025123 [Protea cynaroides]
MGVTSISKELSCPIPPARIFKAAVLDSHNLLPKILPDKIKSIEVQGSGGAGSIKQINLAEDGPFAFIKHRIEELDEANFTVKFTLIEGGVIGEKIEKVVNIVQFVASADAGSIIKVTSEFYTVGDYKMGEDELQMGKEMATGTFKMVEDGPFAFIKHRIEELDEANFKVKFTLIEGAVIGEKIEKVVDTVQFVASADGGSIIKVTSEFYTVGDYKMGEDELQMGKEMATGTFKMVEGYLLENPTAYA